MTWPPGPWLRATDAGATPCSVNQASLDDALDRARHAVSTGSERPYKRNANYHLQGLLKEANPQWIQGVRRAAACNLPGPRRIDDEVREAAIAMAHCSHRVI